MSMINPKIFKPYDIRGIYPKELNEETAYVIGRVFARRAQAKEVVVGSDMRLSGPVLKAKLMAGINAEGVDVVDIGLVPIDAIYFAVGILKYPAGIMITASHNPKEYNGFKMVLKNMNWLRGEELRDDVLNFSGKKSALMGKIKVVDILPEYINYLLSFCNFEKIKPFKVVVDAGNGMAGKIIPLLQKHLSIKVIPLNFELNGNFPAHPSDPSLPESQAQIKQEIKKQKADFGVIFDGDTDRLIFINEKGQSIQADLILLVLAREFLNREPGKGIVYNVICSKVIPEKIKEWGGKPIRSKVGYVHISQAMRENDGIMGGELSSHYSFRDNAYADSGFIAWLILLQLLSEDGRPLSEIVKDFQKYFKSDEINIELSNREAVIAKIKEEYSDGKQDELDGLTVEYNNWWFNTRPSNTESLLRVVVEANTQRLLKQKTKALIDFVNKIK